MSHKKMFGFVDPITLGILIALGGATLGVTQANPNDKPTAVSTAASAVQTPSPAGASMVQAERVTAN
ncbi:MAG: hypothetical protein H6R12_1750 [Proteobacteria bacterium]|jgi:hypothetical protein|nr:hypothetical protein [Pseudomonadota bacterium]